MLDDEKWVTVSTEEDGKYIVFENPHETSNQITFRVLAKENTNNAMLILGSCVVVMMLIALFVDRRRKNKRRIKASQKEQ